MIREKTGFNFKVFAEYLLMIPAALISALVYEIFVFPNVLAPAGINGITTIIQYSVKRRKTGFKI